MTYHCRDWPLNIERASVNGDDINDLYHDYRCDSFYEAATITVDREGNVERADNGNTTEAECAEHDITCDWVTHEDWDLTSDLRARDYYICDDCAQVYGSYTDYELHQEEEHDEENGEPITYMRTPPPFAAKTLHSLWPSA